jgi:hypothetical protein
VGAILGQQIDGTLFGPKRRQGPRLGDLNVQTSSYGTQIPKIFGKMRVAGTVIWSTDLKEERSSSGGGKGQPKSDTYSYSASFAVALSSRPLRSIRRIWADGKLLRGQAGDFKSRTGFRFYLGDESQDVDPLIASIEGLGLAPAHRGIAYSVFEDFQLADYGNRIPSLTFEVEGDTEAITIGGIGEELSRGVIAAGETAVLAGYAASGDSIRSALEALGDVIPLSLEDRQDAIVLAAAPQSAIPVGANQRDARSSKGGGGRSEFSRKGAGSIPGEVSLVYHDVERNFMTGLQRASLGIASVRSEPKAVPAALSADAAKSLAEHRLACLSAGRQFGKVHLAWRLSGIRAGSHVTLEGLSGIWRVARWTVDRMAVSLDLVRVPPGPAGNGATATPGTQVAEPDLLQGPTTLLLFDLPKIEDGVAERPILVAAAAGASAGWRGAALLSSYDNGASWQAEGRTRGSAGIGHSVTRLAPGGSALIDAASSVEVELLNASMWLESRSDDALTAGANLALVGEEVVQFGKAEPLGHRRFRLSRLLRGRRGTEAASATHEVGEPFLLLDPQNISLIETSAAAVGGEYWMSAQGLGDDDVPTIARLPIQGRSLMPPSPVHLRAERLPGGDLAVSWVRRSRNGWNWLGGSDAPLAEESEAYLARLSWQGFERVISLADAQFTYSAAQQVEDGFLGRLRIEVKQIGTHGSSDPAFLDIDEQEESI